MAVQRGVRGPYRSGIERRHAIITQAVETFAANGFHGGTMRNVASNVGVTPAALSRYFSSKEELLIAVLEHCLADWRRYVDAWAGADRRGLAYIRALPRLVQYFRENPGIAQLYMTMQLEADTPEHPAYEYVNRRSASTYESFGRHVREAIDAGDIPAFAPERVALEVAQIVTMMWGAMLAVAGDKQSSSPSSATSSVDPVTLFEFFIEQTIARWQAGAVFGA